MNDSIWNDLNEALRAPPHSAIESSCNLRVSRRTHEILRLSQDVLANIPVLLAVDESSAKDLPKPALQDFMIACGSGGLMAYEVNRIVDEAAHVAVIEAVSEDMNDLASEDASNNLDETVNGIAGWAVYSPAEEDYGHPTLQDFLLESEAP